MVTDSISLLVIGFFRFLVSCWLNLERLYVSKNLYLLGCPVCWHVIIRSSLLWPMYFCGISCNISSFISDFTYWTLFFSWWIWLKVYQYCFFSKNMFHWTLLFFWSIHLFLLWYFLPLTNFALFFFLLRCKVGLFFVFFLNLPQENFSLRTAFATYIPYVLECCVFICLEVFFFLNFLFDFFIDPSVI